MNKFVAVLCVFMLSCASAPPKYSTTASTTNQIKFDFNLDEVIKPKPKLEAPKGDHYVPLIMLNKEIDEGSVDDVLDLLDQAEEAKVLAVIIELNTPGGSVPDGFRLSKRIENFPVPVILLVDGEAASMGYYLLQSGSTRLMTRRSILMLHQPSLGGMIYGNPEKWISIADMLKAMSDAMAEHMARRMFVSVDYVKSRINGGQMWWMGCLEALETGAVDEAYDTDIEVIESYRKTLSPPIARH